MPFFDRTEELEWLRQHTPKNRAALLVLYGRRRIGKTELLRTFSAGRPTIFFVATQTSRADQLASFSQVLFQTLGESSLESTTIPTWEEALRFVAGRTGKAPLLLVLDEFQYLCDSDSSLPSVLQRLWDTVIRDTRLHLVLCGSHVSFMEKSLLGAKNPLYGRRTGQWSMAPMLFRDARLFFPHYDADDRITAFSILGGVPAYLEQFDSRRTVAQNVVSAILSRGAPLYDEPPFLMRQELREPSVYFSVCRAIAHGRSTPNEIAHEAGLTDRGAVSRYLETLRELRVLERRVPATHRNPERSRMGRYRFSDPFFRFWFRFVLPNRSALELGDAQQVYRSKVEPHLSQHVATAFEEVCVQHLWRMNAKDALPARYDRIGGWWRAAEEVDLVAIADDGCLLLGECKWSANPVGIDILDALVAKTGLVAGDLPRNPSSVHYCLCSRSGFTPEVQRRAAREEILLLKPADIAGPDS